MTRAAVFASLRRSFQARVRAWMRRRQGPDALPLTLERRRLYILPTRAGLAFTALMVAAASVVPTAPEYNSGPAAIRD